MERYNKYRRTRIVFILINMILIFTLSLMHFIGLGTMLIWTLILMLYIKFYTFNVVRIHDNCLNQMEQENHDNLEKIANNTKK